MYDLSFGSQATQARAQIADALGMGQGAQAGALPAAASPPMGQQPISPTPQALLSPAQRAQAQGAPPNGALTLGNKALSVGPQMPPPGGPLMAKPQSLANLGMGAMTTSRGAPFQVAPFRQAPGQVATAPGFAKGGHVDTKKFAVGGAWTRKEGQNPEGGLNAKGRASLKAQGHDIKPPVSAKQAAKSPTAAKRRKSFCVRMSGMPGPMKDEKGRPTRKALSLQKWDC
jgi:hypothetical protein